MRENRPGSYTAPITIRKRVDSPTRDGGNKVDWTDSSNFEDYHSTFCRVAKQNSREFYQAKQLQEDLSSVLIVRSSTKTRAIKATMRILFRGRTLEVLGSFDLEELLSEVFLMVKEPKS